MGQLEELIARCERLEEGLTQEERMNIVADYCVGYMEQAFKLNNVKLSLPDSPKDIDDRSIKSIRTSLKALKEHRDHELAVANAGASQANMSMTQTATTTITFSQTMSAMWSIPDNVLDMQRKETLEKMLKELEESKKDGGNKVIEVAKSVGSWLFNEAIKAVPTVIPYVTESIKAAFA